jgi:hypothetical protein
VDDSAWHVRVRATGRGRATAYARQHQFDLGAAVQFDREHELVSGLEYLLGALGADLVAGLQRAAGRRRIALDQVEAVVSGRLASPLVYLGVVGEEGRPDLERVVARVYVGADEADALIQEAWDEALARSPFVGVLARAIELDLSVKAVG